MIFQNGSLYRWARASKKAKVRKSKTCHQPGGDRELSRPGPATSLQGQLLCISCIFLSFAVHYEQKLLPCFRLAGPSSSSFFLIQGTENLSSTSMFWAGNFARIVCLSAFLLQLQLAAWRCRCILGEGTAPRVRSLQWISSSASEGITCLPLVHFNYFTQQVLPEVFFAVFSCTFFFSVETSKFLSTRRTFYKLWHTYLYINIYNQCF